MPEKHALRLRGGGNLAGPSAPKYHHKCYSAYVDKSLHPLKQRDSIVEAAGSYNAALDLIHTALRAESEGERYTGVLGRTTLAFALRV